MDWTSLLDEYRRSLLLYARQWLDDKSDAEDAVQEGFVRFWRRWTSDSAFSRLLRGGDPVPYLFACVRRAALDILKSNKRRRARELAAAAETGEQVAMFECRAESEELAETMRNAMTKLSHEQREVLTMKVWGGLSFRQMARVLHIPLNTAASRYRYALAALQRELGDKLP